MSPKDRDPPGCTQSQHPPYPVLREHALWETVKSWKFPMKMFKNSTHPGQSQEERNPHPLPRHLLPPPTTATSRLSEGLAWHTAATCAHQLRPAPISQLPLSSGLRQVFGL